MQGDAALEQAITRPLTRTEQRKKAIVLECYRDYWRRSARPVCPLVDAEAYLVRAADIVVRLRALLVAEGDTGSPDGTAVMKAQCEKDVERAVLECVNHAVMGGNSAEMLWDLEQCPKENPDAFVHDLVDATLHNDCLSLVANTGYVTAQMCQRCPELEDYATEVLARIYPLYAAVHGSENADTKLIADSLKAKSPQQKQEQQQQA